MICARRWTPRVGVFSVAEDPVERRWLAALVREAAMEVTNWRNAACCLCSSDVRF